MSLHLGARASTLPSKGFHAGPEGAVRDGQERPSWPLWANKQGMPSLEALRSTLTGAKASGKGMLPVWRNPAIVAPSSSLCPEHGEDQRSRVRVASLARPRLGSRGQSQTECSMSSYPVHRSLPPTRRSSSDEDLVPGEVQDKPLNPSATLSLLRAARIVSKGFRLRP